MRKALINAVKYIAISAAVLFVVYLFSVARAVHIGNIVIDSMTKVIPIMLGVSLIIGLIQIWLSPQQISKWIGNESGAVGMVIASTLPIVLGGSMLTMFPLMLALKDKGVPNRILIAFLVAWAGKAPLLPLEIEYLGLGFALYRILLIVPLAITLGLIGENILRVWEEKSLSVMQDG